MNPEPPVTSTFMPGSITSRPWRLEADGRAVDRDVQERDPYPDDGADVGGLPGGAIFGREVDEADRHVADLGPHAQQAVGLGIIDGEALAAVAGDGQGQLVAFGGDPAGPLDPLLDQRR